MAAMQGEFKHRVDPYYLRTNHCPLPDYKDYKQPAPWVLEVSTMSDARCAAMVFAAGKLGTQEGQDQIIFVGGVGVSLIVYNLGMQEELWGFPPSYYICL